ncbi:MAG TPA: hypothetical protein VMB47_06275 [Candidatus Aquilonibacter sp.]|nr:hypothetical protein [Candidatus Aquilonibacter sp.]
MSETPDQSGLPDIQALPPRWMERILRAMLKKRDRDTISGDLLEEFREDIFPTKGRIRADLWYLRQVLSLIEGASFGLSLGSALGAFTTAKLMIAPLRGDRPIGMALLSGVILLLLSLSGFLACHRGGNLFDAMKAGTVAGLVAAAVVSLIYLVQLNLFFNTIRQSAGWETSLDAFQGSRSHNLRAFANYYSAMQDFIILPVVAISGAVAATIGGLAALSGRRMKRFLQS